MTSYKEATMFRRETVNLCVGRLQWERCDTVESKERETPDTSRVLLGHLLCG